MKKISLILSIIVMFSMVANDVLARRYDNRRRDGHHRRRDVQVHRNVTVVNNRNYRHHRHHHHDRSAVAAGVAGLAVGAMIGSATSRPRTVIVQQPVAVAPAYGSVVYALPSGCVISNYNNVQYYQCNGVFHQPVMGSSGVYYQIVPPPY